MDNVINEMIVLPYSPTICRYSINNSEKLHATTYSNVIKIISETCPLGIVKSSRFLERKIPFIINIKSGSVLELSTSEESINKIKNNKIVDELKNPVTINNNTKGLVKSQISSKFWRKK